LSCSVSRFNGIKKNTDMRRHEIYKIFTRIAIENPSKFWNELVTAYKEYNSNQKRIISELTKEKKKLEVRVGQLDSFVNELVSEEAVVISKDKLNRLKAEIQRLRQENIQLERHLIELMYPEYSTNNIPVSRLEKALKIILNK